MGARAVWELGLGGQVGQHAPHLPGGHLPVVQVRVVVPLDGGEVPVERQEDRLHQALLGRVGKQEV